MTIMASEWPLSTGFDPKKAVQIVAYFVAKEGGAIEKLKVTKLIYLSDRLSFQRRSAPMNFDDFYSMPHGPVPSSALNSINQMAADDTGSLVVNGKMVSVSGRVGRDHLSKNDLQILEDVWAFFGEMTSNEIRKWTHQNCVEYKELDTGRLPISYEEIMAAVGAEDPSATMRDLKILQREMGRLPAANAS